MPGPRMTTEKPKNTKKSAEFLLKSLKAYRPTLIFAVLAAILSTILAVFGPMVLGNITTEAVASLQSTGTLNWATITPLLITAATLYGVSGLLGYLESFLLGRLAAKYAASLRSRILAKISRLPISYFDEHQFGDTLSLMSNDIDAVASSLRDSLTEIISNTILFIGSLVMMLVISPLLSLVALIVLPFAGFLIAKVAKKAQAFFVKQRKILGNLNSAIEEDYSGQSIIKTNSHTPESLRSFNKINEDYATSAWKAQFFSSIAFPISHIFTSLGYAAVCVVGGRMAVAKVLTIGNVQSFLQYTKQFNRPMTQIAQIASTIQLTLAATERIFTFLDEPEQSPDPVEPNTLAASAKTTISSTSTEAPRGAVEFHDVSFSYEKDKATITNFSCKIAPGQQVALVGPTGAGKTTIVNLLMRFYDPDSGYITIDGQPTREMPRATVRSLFGMVLQDTWLFSGTIEENLKYGAPQATHDEVVSICKKAHIDHFISSLEDGYATKISEDSDNISAGEKQLLTIARAMIENPPMMILDEATSNVDTRTEQLIQDAITKLTHGRTSFIIAHRLSTIRDADLILVMKDGQVIEQGNHDSLLKQNGFYAELYNSQFKK